MKGFMTCKKECFDLGKAWGTELEGPDRHKALDAKAGSLESEVVVAYLMDQAGDLAYPADFVFGVFTAVGIIEGMEHLYDK